MRIDLHCHTKAVRSGEPESRNVNKALFASKMTEANVKIAAITNHDRFDKIQFDDFQQDTSVLCTLWPGIELNVDHNGAKYHMLVIASPLNVDRFGLAVDNVVSGKTGAFEVDIDAVMSAFNGLEVIFLPHFGNKTPCISQSQLLDLYSKVPNTNRVILEDSNSRSTAILSSHGMRTITGSDIKDWAVYQESDISELRLPVDTFEQFCLFLDRDPTVIKTLLDKNYSKKYLARPSKENESISVNLPLFSEINIVFGDKGTGKSQIIDSIRKKMDADGLSVSMYISSQKDDDIRGLVDSSDMERSALKVELDEQVSDFDFIRNWGDKDIELLQTFVRHGETKHMAANKDRIKFIEPQVLPYDDELIVAVESDLRKAKNALSSIESIQGKYLDDEKMAHLIGALGELVHDIKAAKAKERIKKYECRLLIYSTQRIRAIVAAKTGTVAKPSSTGFYEYAKNRIALRNAANNILQSLEPKMHKEHAVLGNIGDKGDLFVESRWSVLDENSRQKDYPSSPLITKLRDSVANIKNIRRQAFSDDPQNFLDEFQDQYDNNDITRIGVFIGTCKYIVDNDLNEYSPSNGEKAIVLIQRALEVEKDAYLLDEPELSLGGSYIDKVIRPKITALGKAGKTVLIATHNANIAVRTLPYNSIYRLHDNSVYKTYLGNPFTNKLTNILDTSDELDWKDISMKVLEGGIDAFNDRGDIYEAGGTAV